MILNNKKTILKIIFIIIIFAFIIMFIYVDYKDQKEKETIEYNEHYYVLFDVDINEKLLKYKSFMNTSYGFKRYYPDTFGLKSVLPLVKDVKSNNNFILVKQEPSHLVHSRYLSKMHFNYLENNELYKGVNFEDSVLKNNNYYKKVFSQKINYYIIDLRENIKYGPFNFKDYKIKKSQLKVPKELKLENE